MNIVCFGAHPDDCEVHAGGTLVKWAQHKHNVLLVSMTRGDIGHHVEQGEELAQRREAETKEAALRGGLRCKLLHYPDGHLQPTIEARMDVVRIIREEEADVVITHRPFDYHPDHRYTSQVVQDAAFMVTVPHFCPKAPALNNNPVFLYMADIFTKPLPFSPDVAIDIDDVAHIKFDMLDAMESQVYEWLPWLAGRSSEVPRDGAERRQWLEHFLAPRFQRELAVCRPLLEYLYGDGAAAQVRYAEAFELCEYGRQPKRRDLLNLFPFFPQNPVY